MYLYAVFVRVDDILREKRNQDAKFITVVDKIEVKETEKSYAFPGKRISKDKLGDSEIVYDGLNHIGFRTYTLENGIHVAVRDMTEQLVNRIQKQINHGNRMMDAVNKGCEVEYRISD